MASLGLILSKSPVVTKPDDKIRDLCDKALAAPNGPESKETLVELQAALRAHSDMAESIATYHLLRLPDAIEKQRKTAAFEPQTEKPPKLR